MTDTERLEEIEMFAYEISQMVGIEKSDLPNDLAIAICTRVYVIEKNARRILNKSKQESSDFGDCVNPGNVENVIACLKERRDLMKNNIQGVENAAHVLKDNFRKNEERIFELTNLHNKHKNKKANED